MPDPRIIRLDIPENLRISVHKGRGENFDNRWMRVICTSCGWRGEPFPEDASSLVMFEEATRVHPACRCMLCEDPKCPGISDDPGDPHRDGTDAAHPAYWRGQDDAIRVLCQHANALLDEPLRFDRGVAQQPWEGVRRRIMSMARETEELRRALAVFVERERRAGRG